MVRRPPGGAEPYTRPGLDGLKGCASTCRYRQRREAQAPDLSCRIGLLAVPASSLGVDDPGSAQERAGLGAWSPRTPRSSIPRSRGAGEADRLRQGLLAGHVASRAASRSSSPTSSAARRACSSTTSPAPATSRRRRRRRRSPGPTRSPSPTPTCAISRSPARSRARARRGRVTSDLRRGLTASDRTPRGPSVRHNAPAPRRPAELLSPPCEGHSHGHPRRLSKELSNPPDD